MSRKKNVFALFKAKFRVNIRSLNLIKVHTKYFRHRVFGGDYVNNLLL